jgi:hypothetical protein
MGILAIALAWLGEDDRSAEVRDHMLRTARHIGDPSLFAMAVHTAAASFMALSEPDIGDLSQALESNPVDFNAVSAFSQMWLSWSWGTAYLGQGELHLSAEQFGRAVRLADRIGNSQGMQRAVLGLGLVCARSGQSELAAQLLGYVETNLPSLPYEDWVVRAIATHLAESEPSVRNEAGAALDRRGFLQLVADAEQGIIDTQAVSDGSPMTEGTVRSDLA